MDFHKDIKTAAVQLARAVQGAYALVFVTDLYPDMLVAIRHRSPLVIGIGQNEMFVASDFMAFSDKTSKVLFMPDDSIALMTKDSLELYSFDGNLLSYHTQTIDHMYAESGKDGFEHYMLKEIYEQKRAINRTISFCRLLGSCADHALSEACESRQQHVPEEYNDSIWRQLGLTRERVKQVRHINIIGCGTSWHAARIAQFYFESICKVPTRVYLASEYRYMPFFPEPDSLYFMISQSGETADALEALRLINSFEQHTIAVTNVASSTMVREASGFLPMQAGPEISVASTKAFSTQLAVLYWLANRMALDRGEINADQMQEAEENLFVAAEILEAAIEIYKFKIMHDLAPMYAKYERFIFLGRHVSYPFALEASLKLKRNFIYFCTVLSCR